MLNMALFLENAFVEMARNTNRVTPEVKIPETDSGTTATQTTATPNTAMVVVVRRLLNPLIQTPSGMSSPVFSLKHPKISVAKRNGFPNVVAICTSVIDTEPVSIENGESDQEPVHVLAAIADR